MYVHTLTLILTQKIKHFILFIIEYWLPQHWFLIQTDIPGTISHYHCQLREYAESILHCLVHL